MATSGLFQKLLIPVDNSKYAINAARQAIQIAQIHGSQLIFLHVVDVRAIETMVRYGQESKEALLVKAEESGWKILYNPFEHVIHLNGESMAKNPSRSYIEYRRSQLIF